MKFVRVEAEKQPEISEKWSVSVVPTFVAVVNGQEVVRIEGARIPELVQCVAKYAVASGAPVAAGTAASATTTTTSTATPAEEMRARLVKLINYAPVMLFMKGTPAEPRCGFSRQAVELLTGVGAKFCSFNILDHADVRNALKEYSNWPTYPQLYANGKLVGGLDVLKELQAEGELVSSLPKEAFAPEAEEPSGVEALRKLTSRSPVMLFMKGSPRAPQCGFSNAMVQLLASQGIEYDSFDVFSDSNVREGLKEYASWPTYPMLFVEGKLLGGLDIIQEVGVGGWMVVFWFCVLTSSFFVLVVVVFAACF